MRSSVPLQVLGKLEKSELVLTKRVFPLQFGRSHVCLVPLYHYRTPSFHHTES